MSDELRPMFPAEVGRLLDAYGVPSATKNALFDLYVSLGGSVLELFAEIADEVGDPSQLQPSHLADVRATLAERFVRRNHERWRRGEPTASFWCPREAAGRAAGLLRPIGAVGIGESGDFAGTVEARLRPILGSDQPFPRGLLIMGRNGHYSGRLETISFDVVEDDLDEAVRIALAEGRQHTVPGSVGECSGTWNGPSQVALLWELQPNVLKPAGERNRSISKVYRRHRNWHVVTLGAALLWLDRHEAKIFVVKGKALAATHQANPHVPISEEIMALHDRTLARVVEGLGGSMGEPDDEDEGILRDAWPGNVGLKKFVESEGARGALVRVRIPTVH